MSYTLNFPEKLWTFFFFSKVRFTVWYSEKLFRITFQRRFSACIASCTTEMYSLLRRMQRPDVEGNVGTSGPSTLHAVKQNVFTGPLAAWYQRTGFSLLTHC